MFDLSYIDGDVTEPASPTGNKLIVHCCNNCDPPVMGAGVAAALRNKWPQVYSEYFLWGTNPELYSKEKQSWASYPKLRLGEIQVVKCEGDFSKDTGIAVVNLIGQQDTGFRYNMPPIRYESIEEGLRKLYECLENSKHHTNIISPRFGSELAGGSWPVIEEIICDVFHCFSKYELEWVVYNFKK